jgi:hypothetical protein
MYNGTVYRFCKPFMEPRNRFPVWRDGTKSLLEVPTCQATEAGGIDSLESIPGLLKRLKIWFLLELTSDVQKDGF